MTRTAAPAAWVLRFDGIPPSPNARLHFMARAKYNKHWRQLALVTARAWEIPMQQRVRLSAVIIRRALGRADEDNDRARLKPICDGLVDAGVVPDDHRGCVEWGPVTEERGPAGVRLTIEALA